MKSKVATYSSCSAAREEASTNSANSDIGTTQSPLVQKGADKIIIVLQLLLFLRIVEHPGKGIVAGGNCHFGPLVFFRIPKPLAPLRW